jgi:hypothetical protein
LLTTGVLDNCHRPRAPVRDFGQRFQRALTGDAAFHVLFQLADLGIVETMIQKPLEVITVAALAHLAPSRLRTSRRLK